MSNQTENYIILKPIAERFNRITNSITDDEIRSLIKSELKNQINCINFANEIDEIISNYLEDNQQEIINIYKTMLKNKLS
jgi:uncharacterized membrane-anchored protein YjiN (DUF445 family)